MSNVKDLQRVYKKDGAGNTYRVQQTVYKGQIMNCRPILKDPNFTLDNINTMKARETDVWVITFPKSGKMFFYSLMAVSVYNVKSDDTFQFLYLF